MEVVDPADLVGSTEYIIQTIEHAPAGSSWAVGTELHLVNRLQAENPDKTIRFLSPWSACAPPCTESTCLISPGASKTWPKERP